MRSWNYFHSVLTLLIISDIIPNLSQVAIPAIKLTKNLWHQLSWDFFLCGFINHCAVYILFLVL